VQSGLLDEAPITSHGRGLPKDKRLTSIRPAKKTSLSEASDSLCAVRGRTWSDLRKCSECNYLWT